MTDRPYDWRDRHAELCKAFALVASEPGCAWEQWRDAWQAAEDVKAAALGLEPRRPSREAWRKRGSQSGLPKRGGAPEKVFG